MILIDMDICRMGRSMQYSKLQGRSIACRCFHCLCQCKQAASMGPTAYAVPPPVQVMINYD